MCRPTDFRTTEVVNPYVKPHLSEQPHDPFTIEHNGKKITIDYTGEPGPREWVNTAVNFIKQYPTATNSLIQLGKAATLFTAGYLFFKDMGCDALDIDFSNNSHNETSTTFFEGNDTSYNATVTDNLPPSGASLPPFVFPASFRNETDNERFPRSAETAPPSCIRKFGKLKIDVPESLTCPTQYPGSGTVFSVSHYDLPNNGTEETARLGADAKAKYPFVEQSTYEEARRLNPGWSGKEILDMLCKKVTAWTLEIKNDGGLKSKIKFFNNKVDSHKGIGCKRVNTVGPAEKFIARKHRKIYGMQETSVKVETHGGRTHIAAEGWRTT